MTQSQQLITLLSSYFPTNKEELESKKQILTFINQYPNTCFERSLSSGHITASCWLLNKEGTHVLLTLHRKLNRWLQLGGHCDGNPNVLEVALKEAQEESGITKIIPVTSDIFDISVHLIPATLKEPAHYHYDIRFLLQATNNQPIIVSSESITLQWFAKDITQLPTQEPSIIRMFEKWIHQTHK